MNRSFRAPENEMPLPMAVKQRQQQTVGTFRNSLMKDKEDELALFLEMRRREKERNSLLLQDTEEEFDSSLGSRAGTSPMFGMPVATPARKTGPDEFLNSENEKNDYDWLLTPPGTPLFPSLEMESQRSVTSQSGSPKARPTALKSRLSNSNPEATNRNNLVSRQQASSLGLHRPSSSGGPGSRPSTPTGRPTLGAPSRPTSSSISKPTPTSTRPSRPSTPTSRPTLSSSKPASSTRSSTPTARSTARSSTPPARSIARSSTPTAKSTVKSTPRSLTPVPKSNARSSTPTSRPSLPAVKPAPRAPTPTRRPATLTTLSKPLTPPVKSPTVTKSMPNNAPPRASSPSVKPRPWKPQEMPGYTFDAPPNLRTSLSDRPTSATRGRPGAPSIRSSSVEPVPNGRGRRQSCSPSRGRLPNGMNHASGSSVPVPALNRAYAKANDNVSPGSYGTKMVERVINMRKLVPPKQDDRHSPHSNLSGKSSSPDSSGFGRSLSKKSLDMAIRHMDIRRTVPGNRRPLMTNIPASSMYSVRSGPTRTRTISVSDSPLATSSNASSEMSVNYNALCLDGNLDDEINSMSARGR